MQNIEAFLNVLLQLLSVLFQFTQVIGFGDFFRRIGDILSGLAGG